MEFIDIVIRTFLATITLFILSKLMGKKQIGQLNAFDYIIGITIGSIAAEMSINPELEYWVCILAMVIISLIGILISIITTKSIVLRRIITGVPLILIENGNVLEKSLKKARLDINDLLQECRSNGYFNISELEYAILEPNGKISCLLKSKYNPITPGDMKLKVNYKGLCSNLIIDGNIMSNNLKNISKDEKWLLKRLEKEECKIEDILLLTCDSKEKFSIYKKNYINENKVFE